MDTVKTKLYNSARWAVFLLMISFFSLSCEQSKKAGDAGTADSVLVYYQVLTDSVQANWSRMIADDDDKHLLMRRLLLEVSYTNNYDKQRHQELMDLLEKLKAIRYDQITMQNSSLIDVYDSATFAVTDQIIAYAREHPRFEDTPLMAELIDDINGKNNYVLMHRIHYDGWVKQLNAYQDANREVIMEKTPDVELNQMPLFELPS